MKLCLLKSFANLNISGLELARFCFIDEIWRSLRKLECLAALCRALLHPQLILDEEKFWMKILLSTQDGIKRPEMHKKVKVGRGGPATDRQLDDIAEWHVESLFASSKARLKNGSSMLSFASQWQKLASVHIFSS